MRTVKKITTKRWKRCSRAEKAVYITGRTIEALLGESLYSLHKGGIKFLISTLARRVFEAAAGFYLLVGLGAVIGSVLLAFFAGEAIPLFWVFCFRVVLWSKPIAVIMGAAAVTLITQVVIQEALDN